jgi:hypothetical protein
VYAASMNGFLSEARRILRRDGWLLATFPFRSGEKESEIRTEFVNDKLVHHAKPEYHEGPFKGADKRLLFFIPGWDILDAARAAGFKSAEITVQSSRTNAILGAEVAAVFVLKAVA